MVYNYFPEGYLLPNEYTKFVDACRRDPSAVWICKPADLSRGRGISLLRDINELTYDGLAVVQRYIPDPLLVSGYKFDLRLYVAVVSFQPLVVYIHEQGLTRFATEKFNLSSLDNIYSHLTNTSINKFSPTYAQGKEGVGFGCKWSLSQLRTYLAGHQQDCPGLWQGICNIVILTLLAQTQSVPVVHNCVELYGFDILVDEQLKPWLLEVNFSPALHCDCRVDSIVKRPMLSDLIDLLGLQDMDKIPHTPVPRVRTRPDRRLGCSSGVKRAVTHGTMLPARRRLPSLAVHRSRVIRNMNTPRSDMAVNDGKLISRKINLKFQVGQLSPVRTVSMDIVRLPRQQATITRKQKKDQSMSRPCTSPPTRQLECHTATSTSISTLPTSAEQSSLYLDPDLSCNTNDLESDETSSMYGTTHDVGVTDDRCAYTIYGNGSPESQYHGDNERVQLPAKVGGFVLVFPFNEVTRKASTVTRLDVRAITQEIQKEMKKGTTIWRPQ
jgi:tubulin polyglutamylase TTLL2